MFIRPTILWVSRGFYYVVISYDFFYMIPMETLDIFLGPFTQNLCLHSKTRGRAAEWENTKASNVILLFFFHLIGMARNLVLALAMRTLKKSRTWFKKVNGPKKPHLFFSWSKMTALETYGKQISSS